MSDQMVSLPRRHCPSVRTCAAVEIVVSQVLEDDTLVAPRLSAV